MLTKNKNIVKLESSKYSGGSPHRNCGFFVLNNKNITAQDSQNREVRDAATVALTNLGLFIFKRLKVKEYKMSKQPLTTYEKLQSQYQNFSFSTKVAEKHGLLHACILGVVKHFTKDYQEKKINEAFAYTWVSGQILRTHTKSFLKEDDFIDEFSEMVDNDLLKHCLITHSVDNFGDWYAVKEEAL